MSSEKGGSTVAFPYFEQYLVKVLQPAVEKIIEHDTRVLNHFVWDAIVRSVAADQPQGSPVNEAYIEQLLREKLGLKINVTVTAQFKEGADVRLERKDPAQPIFQQQHQQHGPTGGQNARVTVIDRMDIDNPLLKAVAGPKKR